MVEWSITIRVNEEEYKGIKGNQKKKIKDKRKKIKVGGEGV
jgi:hypothetical protein